jgi:formate hydrogenlyase subunit 3/multisubunit Na+/H+ antiporter MnhD subunit
MRPKSIVNFERVVLLWILVGLVNAWLQWNHLVAQMAAAHLGPNVIIIGQGISILINLLLLWFIAHRGSPVAKWIYVVLAAIGLVFGIIGLVRNLDMGAMPLAVTILQYLLVASALWLIFQPDSKAWFSEGRGPDPDAFR